MKVQKEDLHAVAREVLDRARSNLAQKATIVALSGDLGAGKTTFTQALAQELGISETIQSPTYVLMKNYPISPPAGGGRFTNFIHIDAYRLEKPEEFSALKPDSFLSDPANLVVIEWPERVEGQLPAPDVVLKFSHQGNEEERDVEMGK
jgi:tRNA threonylcarbamoyladenosine biosynthesis protein TsaE